MTTITGRTVPPVSAIADVLALWGHDGWLTPPLTPVVAAAQPIIGRVQTVSVTADSSGPGLFPIYDVLSGNLADRFVVIAGAAPIPGAMFGEILALAAHGCGALGVLIDGSVRDRPAMAALGMPVYAMDQCVVGPNGHAHVVAVGQAVTIHGTTIDVDDHIVVDATGCVRVAAALLDDVLDAATRYAAAEDLVVAAMGDGQPLASAYRHKKSIVDELRR
jgi:4-hydroxy-4-methyl-2-oxoglutarate aldolase